MPKDLCMYSTKLFAEKVMPHLRNMWPEYDDDNRFWCSPLAERALPAPLGPDFAPGLASATQPQMVPAK